MISLPTLSLVVAAAFTVPPADDDILDKTRKALLLRSELLRRLELRIGLGPLGSDARFELQFAYDPTNKITVRHSQHVKLSNLGMRGFGGGGREGMGPGPQSGGGIGVKIATAWRKHEWGLSFEESFFTGAPEPTPPKRRTWLC